MQSELKPVAALPCGSGSKHATGTVTGPSGICRTVSEECNVDQIWSVCSVAPIIQYSVLLLPHSRNGEQGARASQEQSPWDSMQANAFNGWGGVGAGRHHLCRNVCQREVLRAEWKRQRLSRPRTKRAVCRSSIVSATGTRTCRWGQGRRSQCKWCEWRHRTRRRMAHGCCRRRSRRQTRAGSWRQCRHGREGWAHRTGSAQGREGVGRV